MSCAHLAPLFLSVSAQGYYERSPYRDFIELDGAHWGMASYEVF